MFDILAIIAGLLISPAYAQNVTCATRPASDSSNACASTAFVGGKIGNYLPLTGGTLTGLLISQNIKSTATPEIVQLYAGLVANAGLVYDLTGVAGATHPEISGIFRMTNTLGTAGDAGSAKLALGAESTCGTVSSSMCWGMTTVLTANAGYSTLNNMISNEGNMNNVTGNNCGDVDYGATGHPCVVNYIAVGGTNQISAGFGVTGSSLIRNGFVSYTGGALAGDFRSYSSAQANLFDTGVHILGIALNGSYSTSAIQIQGSNGLTCPPGSPSGSFETKFGIVIHC